MNKEQESRQKRKTPLTTIAISQEYAKKLDEYIQGFALTRKDFVELAIDYFLRTGFDIRGEAFDLSPLERITNRLESSVKVMEQLNEGTEAMHQLLQAVREQTAKQLPAPEIIANAAEEKAKAESRAEEQGKELQLIQKENNLLRNEIKELQAYKEKAYRELCRVRDEQKTFGKIKSKYRIIKKERSNFFTSLLFISDLKNHLEYARLRGYSIL